MEVGGNLRWGQGKPCADARKRAQKDSTSHERKDRLVHCCPIRLNACHPLKLVPLQGFAAATVPVSSCIPPPECMMAGPVARISRDGPEKVPWGVAKVVVVRKRCLPTSTPRSEAVRQREEYRVPP